MAQKAIVIHYTNDTFVVVDNVDISAVAKTDAAGAHFLSYAAAADWLTNNEPVKHKVILQKHLFADPCSGHIFLINGKVEFETITVKKGQIPTYVVVTTKDLQKKEHWSETGTQSIYRLSDIIDIKKAIETDIAASLVGGTVTTIKVAGGNDPGDAKKKAILEAVQAMLKLKDTAQQHQRSMAAALSTFRKAKEAAKYVTARQIPRDKDKTLASILGFFSQNLSTVNGFTFGTDDVSTPGITAREEFMRFHESVQRDWKAITDGWTELNKQREEALRGLGNQASELLQTAQEARKAFLEFIRQENQSEATAQLSIITGAVTGIGTLLNQYNPIVVFSSDKTNYPVQNIHDSILKIEKKSIKELQDLIEKLKKEPEVVEEITEEETIQPEQNQAPIALGKLNGIYNNVTGLMTTNFGRAIQQVESGLNQNTISDAPGTIIAISDLAVPFSTEHSKALNIPGLDTTNTEVSQKLSAIKKAAEDAQKTIEDLTKRLRAYQPVVVEEEEIPKDTDGKKSTWQDIAFEIGLYVVIIGEIVCQSQYGKSLVDIIQNFLGGK